MPRKALFLVNPAAGKRQSREPLFDAAAVLSQAGYLLNIHLTSGRGDATETARRDEDGAGHRILTMETAIHAGVRA